MIYWKWFFDFSILTNGDWGFFFKETQKDLFSLPYIWSNYSLGSLYITLSSYFSFLYTGILSFIDNFSLSERLVYFWPSILLASIGLYLLAKKILCHNFSALISSFIFSYNTYSILISTGHLTLGVAFALAPFVLYFFIRTLEEKKVFYGIITGVLGFICSTYEFRAFYILAFVLFLYFIFYIFFIEKKIKGSILKNASYAFLPIFLIILLNFYWVFGLLETGSVTSNEIFNRSLFGNEFMNAIRSITLFHPFWTGAKIQPFIIQPIPYHFYLIPIFAFLGLLFNKKNKNVVFFGIISLLGILLTKQVADPFSDIYKWLFDNFPGFNAFREASKFYFLIMLGYSILIGAFIEWLWTHWNKKRWQIFSKYVLTFFIAGIFLWNTKPLITKEIGTLFVSRHIPNDYTILKDKILDEDMYFRTLWVPEQSRWSFYSNQNPKIGLINTIQSDWKNFVYTSWQKKLMSGQESILEFFSLDFSNNLLDISSVKYIIIPIQDIANDDDFFVHYGGKEDPNIRDWYIDQINILPWLKRIDIGTKNLIIYENKNFRTHIYTTEKEETIYENIPFEEVTHAFKNPTEYTIRLENISQPIWLNFSEKYHPDWKVRVGEFHWWEVLWKGDTYFLSDEFHKKNNAKLNSFLIDPKVICKQYTCTSKNDGSFDMNITLYFRPQSFVYFGLIISLTTFVVCIGYLTWYGTRKWYLYKKAKKA